MENDVFIDLEEGEIPEQDLSPRSSESNDQPLILKSNVYFKNEKICNGANRNSSGYVWTGSSGYVNDRLRKRLKLPDKNTRPDKIDDKKYDNVFDLISSDEEKIDVFGDRQQKNTYDESKIRYKKNYGSSAHGTVEDIMSEIDQVVCRKSHNSERKRRSRDVRHSWEKFYERRKCSCKLRTEEVLSNCKRVRKSKRHSDCQISLGISGQLSNHKKKRTKDSSYYVDDCFNTKESEFDSLKSKSKYIRDFDEVRRNLLEKLKKKKEEDDAKGITNSAINSVEERVGNSECTKDEVVIEPLFSPTREVEDNPENDGTKSMAASSCDDEFDIAQLRLIALASNKRKRNSNDDDNCLLKAEKSLSHIEYSSSPAGTTVGSAHTEQAEDDTDVDRNELLLRAEALKTALLKKHQRRLNRLKSGTGNQTGSSSDTDAVPLYSVDPEILQNGLPEKVAEDGSRVTVLKQLDVNFQVTASDDGFKENVMESAKLQGSVSEGFSHAPEMQVGQQTGNNSMKKVKIKSRKKRRKSVILNNSKGNCGDVNQTPEEDCCNLRNQLLCDLIKKKSLKFLEKKSVLLDSMQKSATKQVTKNLSRTVAKNVKLPVSAINKTKEGNAVQLEKVPLQPKIPKPDIERIIVHLGSDDSSEEETGDDCSKCPTPSPAERNSIVDLAQTAKPVPETTKPTDETLLGSYEKKVMLLLGQTRKKVDEELQLAKQKREANATPEAIYKHLPPSQRLEYIRLKQKIAERERERQKRKLSNVSAQVQVPTSEAAAKEKSSEPKPAAATAKPANGPPSSAKPQPEPLPPKLSDSGANATTVSIGVSPTKAAGIRKTCRVNKSDGVPGAKKVATGPLSGTQASPRRNVPNPVLITKLKFLLKKIKLEKTVEENYDKEITKLKTQLVLFEKKKNEQRFKIKRLADESVKTYKLIQNESGDSSSGQRPAVKATEDTAKPAERVAGLTDPKTKQEGVSTGKEDTPVVEEAQNGITEPGKCKEEDVAEGNSICAEAAKPSAVHYNSPLEVFGHGSDKSGRVDPNVILCQFDFTGKCRDEECVFQHLQPT